MSTNRLAADVHILVIDDDRDIRSMLERLLVEEGWPTEGASSGETGLDLARERKPSLVVLDFGLPGLNGEAVACRLHEMYESIPILLVTADGRAREHARNAGAYDYLRKPFDLMALIDAVSRGLAYGREIEQAATV